MLSHCTQCKYHKVSVYEPVPQEQFGHTVQDTMTVLDLYC